MFICFAFIECLTVESFRMIVFIFGPKLFFQHRPADRQLTFNNAFSLIFFMSMVKRATDIISRRRPSGVSRRCRAAPSTGRRRSCRWAARSARNWASTSTPECASAFDSGAWPVSARRCRSRASPGSATASPTLPKPRGGRSGDAKKILITRMLHDVD